MTDVSDSVEGYDPFSSFDATQRGDRVKNPYPDFARLRSRCPVQPDDSSRLVGLERSPFLNLSDDDPVFTVLGYRSVNRVLRDHESFSSKAYEGNVGLVFGHSVLEMDEPEHRTYRRLIAHAFLPREMERWAKEYVQPIVDETISTFAGEGHADLVREFTWIVPNKVISTAMGLPARDLPQFYAWAIALLNVGAEPMEGLTASGNLAIYFSDLTEERRGGDGHDIITLLANARLDDEGGRQLTNEEICSFLRLLLPAASDTTYRATSNLLYGLLSNPEQLQALIKDRTLLPRAIEEGLRWEPPMTVIPRLAVRDVELEGVHIPAGTTIEVGLGPANHDPEAWPNPETFDIFREPQTHLAFGAGNHLCMGMHLAKVEIGTMVSAVLDRLPRLRLDPTVDPDSIFVSGLGFRTPASLPVVFG